MMEMITELPSSNQDIYSKLIESHSNIPEDIIILSKPSEANLINMFQIYNAITVEIRDIHQENACTENTQTMQNSYGLRKLNSLLEFNNLKPASQPGY